MAKMSITELRRSGAGQLEDTPVKFEWDSETHTSMQGDLEFELMAKTSRHEPPGADEPVEHVLAATWQPFGFQGEWSDRHAGAGFAQSMLRDVSRLVGRTPLVRVEIDQLSFVGLLTNLKIRYRTRDQIGWALTLSPHRNETVGSFRPASLRVSAKPISLRIEEISEAASDVTGAIDDAADLPFATEDLDAARLGAADLDDAVLRAQAASSDNLVEDAQRSLLAIAAQCRRVREAAATVALGVSDLRTDVVIAYDDAIATLRCEEWLRNSYTDSVRTLGIASITENEVQALAQKKPRAIHRARSGETWERISDRYYGTPDAWRVIFDANPQGTLVLVGGEEIIVPERAA